MSTAKLQKFATDVVHDLRSRGLLPVAVLLVAAIVAAPILIARSGGDEAAPTAPVSSQDASELAPENQSAVVAYNPGLRDYKTRLRGLAAKDPFRQQFAAPAAAAAEAVDSGSVDISTGEVPSGGGGGDTVGITDGGSGGGSKQKKTKTKTTTKYFVYDTDVLVGEVGTQLVRLSRIQQFTMLPSQEAPALVYLGLAAANTQAIFLVSRDVTGVGGTGTCYPDASSCQLLGLAVGGAAELAYSPTGKTYRIELAQIKRRTTSKPPG